jgi:hypothetical protein
LSAEAPGGSLIPPGAAPGRNSLRYSETATVGGTPRVAVSEYLSEFLPGAAPGGINEPPGASALKVYKLLRTYPTTIARDAALADYNSGAVPRGAPPVSVLANGSLAITGEQFCWSVCNDLDATAHQSTPGSTAPLQVEVQQSTWAYNQAGALGNTLFIAFKIINRGSAALDDLRIGFWSDPDVGGSTDDLVGCDSTRSLGYAYNSGHTDAEYGLTPPAVGYDLLQGPFSAALGHRLPMTSFVGLSSANDPTNASQAFQSLCGHDFAGNPIVAPGGKQTTYMFYGDPVEGTGWVALTGTDRRMLLGSGPVSLAAGESQTVVLAIIVAQGVDRFDSVDRLRQFDDQVQAAFDAGTIAVLDVPGPALTGLSLARVYPNPARNNLQIECSLAEAGEASLELLDLAGRRVLLHPLGVLGAGPHSLSLAGSTGALPAGVYFLRLRQGTRSVSRRVALSR